MVPSTIHSPSSRLSRCKYFCVVFKHLCPIKILTVSALLYWSSFLVVYACLMSYSLMLAIVGSFSFLARRFLNFMKPLVYLSLESLGNSRSSDFRLCSCM